jgi:hypothetical protein
MNYTEIKDLALGYADRTDPATVNQIENFLKIIESRVNKKLKTQKMGSVTSQPCVVDQIIYSLPTDFAGLRDVKIVDGDSKKTLSLATPEHLTLLQDDPNSIIVDPSLDNGYYAIIADKINIYPTQKDTASLDLVYYKKVPSLNSVDTTNWLAENHPDCYVFGLVVEISAFVKDSVAKDLWEARFKESMLDLHLDDSRSRWSGPPMQVRAL